MTGGFSRLRWWIVGLLFLATVLNYIDRQSLSVLARTIQDDLHMSDLDYSQVVGAFLLAYTLMFLAAGRIADLLGTRASMAVFISWWSIASILTALVRSSGQLAACRFLLGMGEPGNYTAAPKAVSEWFPPKERGLAIGIYTAGATVGATVAPPLIGWLGSHHGWRWPFVFTGAIGLTWVVPWLWLCRKPKGGPAAGRRELAPREAETVLCPSQPAESEWDRWRTLLTDKITWRLLLSRSLTDPVWYFYLFWFPKYLTDARHLDLVTLGRLAWLVYLAADIGSLVGGWASGRLVRRGVPLLPARFLILTISAVLAPLGAILALRPPLAVVLLLAATTAAAHLSWQVTLGAVILDVYPERHIATVFGIVATGSGLGGLLSTGLIGHLVTEYSYLPVFALMGLLHPVALLLLRPVRRHPATAPPAD